MSNKNTTNLNALTHAGEYHNMGTPMPRPYGNLTTDELLALCKKSVRDYTTLLAVQGELTNRRDRFVKHVAGYIDAALDLHNVMDKEQIAPVRQDMPLIEAFKTLQTEPTFSVDVIDERRRQLLEMYKTERVNDLGPYLRETAERATSRINLAHSVIIDYVREVTRDENAKRDGITNPVAEPLAFL